MKKWLMFALALCLVVLTACGSDSTENPDWGITMTAENVTPTGCTVVYTQSGGTAAGGLLTSYEFFITKQGKTGWKSLPVQMQVDIVSLPLWIAKDDVTRWEAGWKNLYGSLEPGNYRICQTVEHEVDGPNYEEQTFWAEFTIQ